MGGDCSTKGDKRRTAGAFVGALLMAVAGAGAEGAASPVVISEFMARSYLFLDEILVQNGTGLPGDWGGDWQMDPRVVTNAACASRIRDGMKSLPVISIALDPLTSGDRTASTPSPPPVA